MRVDQVERFLYGLVSLVVAECYANFMYAKGFDGDAGIVLQRLLYTSDMM